MKKNYCMVTLLHQKNVVKNSLELIHSGNEEKIFLNFYK